MQPLLLLVAATAQTPAATPPAVDPQTELSEAAHAITAGRYDQAKAMLAIAIRHQADGRETGRLVADLAFAKGNYAEALARYRLLIDNDPHDALILTRAAIAAFNASDFEQAAVLAKRAIAEPNAGWRAWNTAGAVADLNRDFAAADSAYSEALKRAPARAEILNNIGWSHILRGDWQGALAPLQQAAASAPDQARIADNLELATAANAADLPARRAGESDESWAARLNDAGVAAVLRDDTKRAAAAFAQAIEARATWYRRAADNLQRLPQ